MRMVRGGGVVVLFPRVGGGRGAIPAIGTIMHEARGSFDLVERHAKLLRSAWTAARKEHGRLDLSFDDYGRAVARRAGDGTASDEHDAGRGFPN